MWRAEPPNRLRSPSAGFDLRSVLSCVIITALGSVVAYYVAGKALAPLRKLSESVATIDEHTLSQRLPAATAKDEVGALTEGFNGMLTRLDDASCGRNALLPMQLTN